MDCKYKRIAFIQTAIAFRTTIADAGARTAYDYLFRGGHGAAVKQEYEHKYLCYDLAGGDAAKFRHLYESVEIDVLWEMLLFRRAEAIAERYNSKKR